MKHLITDNYSEFYYNSFYQFCIADRNPNWQQWLLTLICYQSVNDAPRASIAVLALDKTQKQQRTRMEKSYEQHQKREFAKMQRLLTEQGINFVDISAWGQEVAK